jgi:hypothetical protein
MGIRRGNEQHLLVGNERLHQRVEIVQYLIVVKRQGTFGRPETFLEFVFAS